MIRAIIIASSQNRNGTTGSRTGKVRDPVFSSAHKGVPHFIGCCTPFGFSVACFPNGGISKCLPHELKKYAKTMQTPNRRFPANAPHFGQNPTKGAQESPFAPAAPTKAPLSVWEQLATQEYGIKVTLPISSPCPPLRRPYGSCSMIRTISLSVSRIPSRPSSPTLRMVFSTPFVTMPSPLRNC